MSKIGIFFNGLFKENPSFVQILGMCPLLAVSTSMSNAIGMGLTATVVLMCSNAVISLLRKLIPSKIRIASYIIIIAAFVTMMQMLLKGSIRMTDTVYDNMKQAIDKNIENVKGQSIEWPEEIINQVKPDYSFLFSEDFPACASPINASEEELLFLNIQPTEDLDYIRECMELSKCYNWLKDLIKKAPNHEMYFGAIAVQLHDRLLDEPRPYRKDIKVLLANLLSWISILRCTDLIIDKPNYSQRVRLAN